jgi:MOSC domain-containing protein YiiM
VPKIESVNIGREQAIPGHPKMARTGIYKTPVAGPVRIGKLAVEGDCVFDQKHHGGPDQAVYVYFSGDYDWWSKTLGRTIAPGTFGDNVTISGLTSADLSIGDRLVADDVVLEVAAPRIPCNTLAARMDDSGFVKAYRDAGRPGAYCRVIDEGEVRAGMEIAHQPYQGRRIAMNDMFHDWFVRKTLDAARLKETLAAPIAVRARKDWEELLAAAEGRR